MSTLDHTEFESPAADGRYCAKCFEWQPIDQFRRRHKGTDDRHRDCNGCHALDVAERSSRRRRSEHRKLVRTINKGTETQAIKAFVQSFVACHGGVEGYCATWLLNINAAEPGSRWALSSFAAIGRLAQIAAAAERTEQAKTAGEVERLSDDEVAAQFQGEVERLIEENPDLAVEALRRRGWTVIQPDGQTG